MLKNLTLAVGAFALIGAALVAAPATAGGTPTQIRIEGRLSGKGLASGKATYRDRFRAGLLEQRFKVNVEDMAANTDVPVAINGDAFAIITTNALGAGEFQYRTAQFIDDPGDGSPLPSDFPRLSAGTTVTAGPLSGVMN